VRTGEILAVEAARLEAGDGDGVTQHQGCRGAGCGSQVQGAGFLVHGGVQCQVGAAGELGIRVAGQGDDARANPLGDGNDGDQFLGRAGIGDRQQDVLAGQHAQVAVDGLGRVHEEGRRAGGCQRGGDLAGDVAGLADAGDDDAAGAVEDQVDCLGEVRVDAAPQGLQGLDLDVEG